MILLLIYLHLFSLKFRWHTWGAEHSNPTIYYAMLTTDVATTCHHPMLSQSHWLYCWCCTFHPPWLTDSITGSLHFHSTSHILPMLPPTASLATTTFFSLFMGLLFVLYVFCFSDSTYHWNRMLFVFLYTYFSYTHSISPTYKHKLPTGKLNLNTLNNHIGYTCIYLWANIYIHNSNGY